MTEGEQPKKFYIAENYRSFRDYCKRENIWASDHQFIATDREERLRGQWFEPGQVIIIGDPHARLSFWRHLNQCMMKPN